MHVCIYIHIGIVMHLVMSILLAINHIIIVRPRVGINLALKIIGASPTLVSQLSGTSIIFTKIYKDIWIH